MRNIIYYMNKYDDIAETLGGVLIMALTSGAILGFAPLIMWLEVNTW
tara:strand:- start:211 stop:351 length:141 start_codon:yes stop_codon:yes gene_type:complete